MSKVPQPRFVVIYEGTDITADISDYLNAVTYTDEAEGGSDEVTLTVDDTEGLWAGAWFPTKGDSLSLKIGYDNNLIECGDFQVDEIEGSGPPDTVEIKALATPITESLKTKRSTGFENCTLKSIADKVAGRHGLKAEGIIEDVRLGRVTQNRESDLAFLKRIAKEYGYVFSVRGTRLTFTSVYELEGGNPVTSIDKTDVTRWNLTHKTSETYEEASVKHQSPDRKELIKHNEAAGKDSVKKDSLEMRGRVENEQQARIKAKAALYEKNTRELTGKITTEGSTTLLAGVNFELTGFGEFSGVFYAEKTTHRLMRNSGYTTDAKIKRVNEVPGNKKTPNKIETSAVTNYVTG